MIKKTLLVLILISISGLLFSSTWQEANRLYGESYMLEDIDRLWKSIELYGEAINENPDNPEIYLSYLNPLSMIYNYDVIENTVKKGLSCNPTPKQEADLWQALGIYGLNFEQPGYEVNFQKALNILTTLEMDTYNTGMIITVLLFLDRNNEALIYINEAEKSLPANDVNMLRSMLMDLPERDNNARTDSFHERRKIFRNSIILKSSAFTKEIVVAYQKKDNSKYPYAITHKDRSTIQEKIKSLNLKVKVYPNEFSLYLKLANAQGLVENYRTVKLTLESGIDNVNSNIEKAQLYHSLGFFGIYFNNSEYKDNLEKALELYRINVDSIISNRNIPIVLKALGREVEARDFVEKIYPFHPKMFIDEINLTLKYFNLNDYRKVYSEVRREINMWK